MSTESPRVEPWLLLMLSSFVPIALMLLVPDGARGGLAILACAPLLAGFAILMKKHWPKSDAARAPRALQEVDSEP